mgnify:FL=1
MARLRLDYTTRFGKDVKRLRKRNADLGALREVIRLIELNDVESREELRRRHRAHLLRGRWEGAAECHVANSGNWLMVWQEADGVAVLLRTGTHQEIFR